MEAEHLTTIATAARLEATLETRERELRGKLKDAERAGELGRWEAVEGVIAERTVEVAAKWAAAERERQVTTNRLKGELAALQAQRQVVREALILAARRWTFSNHRNKERSN